MSGWRNREPRWVRPSLASYLSGRSEATIRAWMRNGHLPVACCIRTKKLLVNAGDVAQLARAKHHRPTRRTRPGRMLDRIA